MTDPHELGRRIGDLVPDPPVNPGRTSSVLTLARRRRRRRTGLVAGGAAAAVAAVTLTVAGLGTSTPQADPSAPTSSPPVSPTGSPLPTPTDPVTDLACPAPQQRSQDYVDPTSAGALPDGAVVARACPTTASFGFAPPVDALVTGVDRLERTLQGLPPLDNDGVCNADLGLSYWLVLGYPDGTERVVEGHNYGCHELRGAGPERGEPERVWNLYLRLMGEQRAASTPPAGTGIGCPAPDDNDIRTSPLATSTDLEHAVLRWRRADTESLSSWVCAPIPDADLRTITADLASPDLDVTEAECREATLQLSILGVNAWGDLGSTSGDCGVWYVNELHQRRLGPEAQAIVDRIVAEGGAPPLPEATPELGPDEVVLLFTDLLNDGRRDQALALTSDPSVADVGGTLDVKVEGVTGLPVKGPLGTPREVAVTTLYRVVPPDGSFVDYVEAEWRLSRRPSEIWSIDSVTLGDVVPTGR